MEKRIDIIIRSIKINTDSKICEERETNILYIYISKKVGRDGLWEWEGGQGRGVGEGGGWGFHLKHCTHLQCFPDLIPATTSRPLSRSPQNQTERLESTP